eukprot:CAMPEP_0206241314 /NCGR_PEP_ID=MMETSP0047_2-20121206/16426_1 /ASSEMBLY_ACC=CAM_ASM_000192 /TAXON_ID=195065 /ORGANISM="Chroomonas mesostigmatica_cf, Strain CCMP1168" /LENGTH=233 /DNA_ID=CAMNT_0053666195 /DNA_START=11 /DNA_END=712 /DNA_ORIENTATION=+
MARLLVAAVCLACTATLAGAFTAPSALPARSSALQSATSLAPRAPLLGSQRASPALRSGLAPRMAVKGIDFPELDGAGMRIGVVYTRWNKEVVEKLRTGAKSALTDKCNVKAGDIVEFEVPGAWELPVAARYMALAQKVDAVICIGVLIKGETDHYDMIKDAACSALMTLQLETGIPVLNGILGCHNMEQAEARATGDGNHGVWWGQTAVEMATLRNAQMGKTSSPEKKKVLF